MQKKLFSTKIGFSVLFYLFITAAFISVPAFAGVTVYCEGAYTVDDLAIYIYADITDGIVLRSAGVKLGYNESRLQVNEENTKRNNDVWFLGDNDYNSPKFADGEVIFILGKLDPDRIAEGVSGNRVLLGKVVLIPPEGSSMPDPSEFNITLGYGKLGQEGKFANFVDTANPANVLDDTGVVTFGKITIAQRGDANADGFITNLDMGTVRKLILNGKYVCYADVDKSGSVTFADMQKIRKLILGN